MKNYLYKTLIAFVLLAQNLHILAYDFEVDGLCYNKLSNNQVEITYKSNEGGSYSGTLVIPSKVTYNGVTYNVTSIGNKAFYNCTGLTGSLTIPNSVTIIEYSAFSGCSGFNGKLTIGSSVTSIGSHAFSDCSGLTGSLTIPNSVTTIDYAAFYNCSGFSGSLYIPNSVTNIGEWAFDRCSGLASITIPNSVTSIGNYAFIECSALTDVISEIQNPFEIEEDVFSSSYTKATLTVPSGKKTKYQQTNYWNKFTNIKEKEGQEYSLSITAYGGGTAYYDGTSIRNTTRSFTVNESASATITFSPDNGYRIKSVKVNNIDASSSVSNNQYTISNIEANVTVIIEFEVISTSSNITFADVKVKAICVANWDTNGDGELSMDEAAAVTGLGTVFKGNTEITSFDELQYFTGLTTIANSAFNGCSRLTGSLSIPNSVRSIGEGAFQHCIGITSITIPHSVTDIESGAFEQCCGLISITIPNSVTSIGYQVFAGCSGLTSIAIPNSVTSIGSEAFAGCTGLTSITVSNGNTKYDSRNNCNAIIETSSNTLITGCKTTIIPNSVTSIGWGAFDSCSSLTLITIPNSVTHIGNYSFVGCTGLTSIMIPNSVTSIGNDAFAKCSSLTSITIPNSVTSIGDHAFWNCSSLTSVISEILHPFEISNNVFQGVSSNATLQVPKGTKSKYEAFFGWTTHFKEIIEDCNSTPYTLSISVSGPGSVSYNNTQIKEGTRSFPIEEGSTASMSISPDEGFRLNSMLVNGIDVTDVVYNNMYTTNLITDNVSIDVQFGSWPIKMVIDNIAYNLEEISKTAEVTYKSAGHNDYSGDIVIPETVSYNNITYNVISIGPSAFYHCNTLLSVDIPESIVSICYRAFCWCESLASVSLPKNIKRLGDEVFYGCTSLSTVISNIETPFSIYESTFRNISTNAKLYVPKGSKSKYAKYENWTKYFQEIVEIGDTPSITTYSLSITASGNGSASYNSTTFRNNTRSFTVNEGASATISFTPDNGYRIKSVKVNSTNVTSSVSNNKYTISNINANTTLEVEFEAIPVTTYTLSIKATGNGSASYNGTAIRGKTSSFTVNEGTKVSISLTPDDGYRIKSVKHNNTNVTSSVSNNQYTISYINANTTLEVEFEAIPVTTYSLNITATGNGYASYNGTAIRNKAMSFTVTEGTNATITFSPDNGNSIASVKLNNSDVTSQVSGNRYTINNITANTTLTVTFQEDVNALTVNGVNYTIVSQADRTVKVTGGDFGQVLTVPATVTQNGKTWTVTGIDANALKNNTELAAVIWNPTYNFTATVSNPNLLLYVKAEQYAPSSIQNVVVNGTASNIVLKEASSGNDFYCPQAFVAQKISYTHNYQMQTGLGESKGWETIALPFDVQTITHETKGTIVPFAQWNNESNKKPFWLMELTGTGFVEAGSIKAYTPYIISMPNNPQYDNQWLLKGKVTFAASSVTVAKTENLNQPVYNGRTFIPCFAERKADEGFYALNVNNDWETNNSGMTEGSKFVLNMRKIHPFEAYMTSSSNAAPYFDVFDEMTTRIQVMDEGRWMKEEAVYDLQGRKVENPSKKGVYIVNGKKMIIK